eukprot:Gregarina_sp_Poly_1__6780@NODE_365_length_9176_cov_254_590076_g301_i0_p2_GENE_NODE_365_length_9176_cov_254_590076_g301_i0NODE_365_length_9176_cov_254_590076_g301_i0_p2_ORF_typecomplete_len564_score51_58_NODE_365_length_9176_cov_254_590076_g301_i066238314
MRAASQQKRRRQSLARVVVPNGTANKAPPTRHMSSRFEDQQIRRFSSGVDNCSGPSFPAPHRRRLLSDIMNTTHFKQAKSAVMCVGNIPTTTPQFYYTGPVDRYDLSAGGPRSSIDLSPPAKRYHRRGYKEGIQPQTAQDLAATCGSSVWKVPPPRSSSRAAARTRISGVRGDSLVSQSQPPLSARLREKRSHTVQLQRIPAFVPSVDEVRNGDKNSSRDAEVFRPTPRRRMSQASHHTARLSAHRSVSTSNSSSCSSRNENDDDDEENSESTVDLTRVVTRTTDPNVEECSESHSRATDEDTAVDERDEESSLDPLDRNYVTFTDAPEPHKDWQHKIVLRFSSNFWSGECSTSVLEQTIHQAFLSVWTDPKRRECMIQESCRWMEQGLTECGRGMLEVERSLHRLITNPPAGGALPAYFRCGGGFAMPISSPKLETGGPSFFICLRRHKTKGGDPLIPYVSDCYDRISSQQDLRQAWYYLARSGAAALISQLTHHDSSEPVIMSLCTRHFVQYAYVVLAKESSPRQGLMAFPLSRKLMWQSAEDREDISTLSYCVAAWLRRC